jgi:hypothetical protein
MSSMERVNLNLEAADRARLRRLARRAHVREAELVRALLLRAIEQAEREDFADRVNRAQTTERRARDRQIARALEKLRG